MLRAPSAVRSTGGAASPASADGHLAPSPRMWPSAFAVSSRRSASFTQPSTSSSRPTAGMSSSRSTPAASGACSNATSSCPSQPPWPMCSPASEHRSLMAILIVTHSRDNESVELVARALEKRGEHAYRLDTDLYPTEVRLSLTDEGEGRGLGRIDGPRGPLDLSEVTAIWYRRNAIGAGIPADLDPQLRRPSIEESRRMVFGMMAALEVFTVDPLEVIRRAEHKPLQLRLARRLGLEVPRTLSTNDPEAVRAFARSAPGGIITKMMASFAVHRDGVEHVVFTNPV